MHSPESKSNPRPHARELLKELADSRKSSTPRAVFQLATTLLLFASCWVTIAASWNAGFYWPLLLIPVCGGLLVRIFVLQHDCGHRSFLSSVAWNDAIGSALGVLTLTPYHTWRRWHAIHHSTSGDLDRRGRGGEIWVMTLKEYQDATPFEKLQYRLYRHPFTLLVVGPLYQFVIQQRFTIGVPKTWKRERRSIHLTNLGIAALFGTLIFAFGWQAFLLTHLPTVLIAGAAGVWLFYVQHQYEDAYFHEHQDWDYAEAALDGSSHYRLPKVLEWFSANIGYHHLHHLDSKIPNYSLAEVEKRHPNLQAGSEITLLDSLRCWSLKLWDEDQGKMIGFPSRDEIAEGCDAEALEYEDKISPALLTPSSQQPTPGPLPAASVASAPVLVATEDGGK